MSHSRTRSLVLAAAVMAAALAPAAVAGAAAPAKGDTAKAEHDRIVAYWTPERMKAAKPRDFVRNADGSFSLAATPKGKPSENKGKPGGSDGGSGGTSTTGVPLTSGASWSGGQPVVTRTGKVYFRMGGNGYICSGSVVDDGGNPNFSLVLTAGHCAYDESVTDGTGFADYWLFIPDFDNGAYLQSSGCSSLTTLGCWTAERLVVHEGFSTAGGFTDQATQHDFAIAVVGPGGHEPSRDLGDVVGGGYRLWTDVMAADRLSAFGYPAEGKYKGNDLTFCSGTLTKDPYNRITDDTDPWGMACKMNGGSSGGPWIRTNAGAAPDMDVETLEADGTGGIVGSLNSYGYPGISYMFGPVFNEATTAVHNEALKGLDGGDVAVKTPPPPPKAA